MKATGIVRKLDDLGRIVVPIEIRNVLKMKNGDPLEIFTEGENLILRKYTPGCNCCKNMEVTETVLGVPLCKDCLDEFAKVANTINKIRK